MWGWWVVWKTTGNYGYFCLKDLWEFLLKKSLVFEVVELIGEVLEEVVVEGDGDALEQHDVEAPAGQYFVGIGALTTDVGREPHH